jgi:hypothetical protein
MTAISETIGRCQRPSHVVEDWPLTAARVLLQQNATQLRRDPELGRSVKPVTDILLIGCP